MQKAKNPPERVFLMLNDKYIFNIHKYVASRKMTRRDLALRAVAKATLSSFVLPSCPRTLYESRRSNMFRIWCTQEDSNFRPLGS